MLYLAEHLEQTFRVIADTHGLNALLQERTLVLLYEVYNPEAINEQLLVRAFAHAGSMGQLHHALSKETYYKGRYYLQVKSTLCVEYFFSEAAAEAICKAFFQAIGGNFDDITTGIQEGIDLERIFAIFRR